MRPQIQRGYAVRPEYLDRMHVGLYWMTAGTNLFGLDQISRHSGPNWAGKMPLENFWAKIPFHHQRTMLCWSTCSFLTAWGTVVFFLLSTHIRRKGIFWHFYHWIQFQKKLNTSHLSQNYFHFFFKFQSSNKSSHC